MWAEAMRRALRITGALALLCLAVQVDEYTGHRLALTLGPVVGCGVAAGVLVHLARERKRRERLRQLR